MTKSFTLFTVLVVLSASAQAAPLPGNSANGKKLLEANCVSCHTDSVYKRKDRRITSLEALSDQVNNCDHQMKGDVTRDQTNDLVKYLNETYYKFK
ncbi:MAG: hypothetical protein AAB134_00145 [Pseudomonadota bacterium]